MRTVILRAGGEEEVSEVVHMVLIGKLPNRWYGFGYYVEEGGRGDSFDGSREFVTQKNRHTDGKSVDVVLSGSVSQGKK